MYSSLKKHPEYQWIIEFKEANWIELCKRHRAHGIGVGWKVTSGQKTDRLALLFYVERKLPKRDLGERMIPKRFSFMPKGKQDSVKIITDVIETPAAELE